MGSLSGFDSEADPIPLQAQQAVCTPASFDDQRQQQLREALAIQQRLQQQLHEQLEVGSNEQLALIVLSLIQKVTAFCQPQFWGACRNPYIPGINSNLNCLQAQRQLHLSLQSHAHYISTLVQPEWNASASVSLREHAPDGPAPQDNIQRNMLSPYSPRRCTDFGCKAIQAEMQQFSSSSWTTAMLQVVYIWHLRTFLKCGINLVHHLRAPRLPDVSCRMLVRAPNRSSFAKNQQHLN